MEEFQIYPVSLSNGLLAVSPIPGRGGNYAGDLEILLQWQPALVLSMVELEEFDTVNAASLPSDLHGAGIEWCHLPVEDYGPPDLQTQSIWPAASQKTRAILAQGGRVLAHCRGGKGRSGMAALRVMVEMGEAREAALARLRLARQGAVETEDQMVWAFSER